MKIILKKSALSLCVLIILLTSILSGAWKYFVPALAFLLAIFLPGYTILNLLCKNFKEQDKVILSFACGTLIVFIFSLLGLISGQIVLWSILYFVLSLISLFFFLKNKWFLKLYQQIDHPVWVYLALIFLLIGTMMVIISIVPEMFFPGLPSYLNSIKHYRGQIDYYMMYGVAQALIHKLYSGEAVSFLVGGWQLGTRTPYLAIISIPFLKIFGNDPFIYQMLCFAIDITYIIPAYFLLIKLFSPKTAKIGCLFALSAPFMLRWTIYSPQKILTLYFLFTLLYLFLKDNKKAADYFLIGTIATLSLFTHTCSIIGILAIYLFVYLKTRELKKILLSLKYLLLISVIFFLPWFYWILLHEGLKNNALSIYLYPVAQNSDQLVTDPRNIFSSLTHTSPQTIIANKFYNFMTFFVPNPLAQLRMLPPGYNLGKIMELISEFCLWGAVGVFLFPFTIYGAISSWQKYKKYTIAFLIFPLIFYLCLIGYYHYHGPLAYLYFTALMILFLALDFLLSQCKVLSGIILTLYFLTNTLTFTGKYAASEYIQKAISKHLALQIGSGLFLFFLIFLIITFLTFREWKKLTPKANLKINF
ncbi:MAG: glycosyltransferase family 39 protein [Candidatus Doudnabacteria bacterium]